MANNRNERRRRSNQADLEEELEVERRVDNMLMDHYAEIIDDILPIEHKRKFVCEHYKRSRDEKCRSLRDDKCRIPKDLKQILRVLTDFIVMYIYMCLPDVLVLLLTTKACGNTQV